MSFFFFYLLKINFSNSFRKLSCSSGVFKVLHSSFSYSPGSNLKYLGLISSWQSPTQNGFIFEDQIHIRSSINNRFFFQTAISMVVQRDGHFKTFL